MMSFLGLISVHCEYRSKWPNMASVRKQSDGPGEPSGGVEALFTELISHGAGSSSNGKVIAGVMNFEE